MSGGPPKRFLFCLWGFALNVESPGNNLLCLRQSPGGSRWPQEELEGDMSGNPFGRFGLFGINVM